MTLTLFSTAAQVAAPGQPTGIISLAWLMIAIPAVSSALLLVCGRRSDRWGHLLATLASWASFAVGLGVIIAMLSAASDTRRFELPLFSWIPAGEFSVNFGLMIDPLSMTFVMLVTFVGSLIHVYAIAYMAHDDARRRFFAYLNLFIAAMLILVLADSYAGLFVGWEGVGLASYLLIGFWNYVPANAVAAKKAFVMNRVGDMGLLIAMMAMVANFSTVNIEEVNAAAATVSPVQATIIGFFLLVGACGKSAQFPLQAWLGDAMAGPTPVSALIHAATMVTAGVYLIVRSGAIFQASPIAATAVVIVGAITLLFGAIVGCAKDDMKKVLAASTMSQIGYMMLGAGLGPIGWVFAIFHLFTHGFFKALMFSKDKIIEAAFGATTFAGHEAVWAGWVFGIVTMVGAGITAFYMSRLFFMTFHGTARWTTEAEGNGVHPHESGPLMTIPMVILAVCAAVVGGLLSIGDVFTTWLEPSLGVAEHAHPVAPEIAIQVVTLLLVLAGAGIAWAMYGRREVPTAIPAGNALTRAARVDLYQDTVNEALFMTPGIALVKTATLGDDKAIDGVVHLVEAASTGTGRAVGFTQSGRVRTYASYILGGVVCALAAVLAFSL